jgi:adenosylcobinamide kinase/adenosylcobinamide-phosphate guanylyltransferase
MGQPVVYVATAEIDPDDREWQQRIAQHQQRRPADWLTLHVPVSLAVTLTTATPDICLLIDSLGTWLANGLDQDQSAWEKTEQVFLNSLLLCRASVILVAEETGWGVVPAYPAGREFRDRLGGLVRKIGAIAHAVYLVTGGYVLNLSQLGTPLPE